AYVLGAFYSPERHVVNDLLGGKPITVTYCDVTDCLAVFIDPDSKGPLGIAVGGWLGKRERGRYIGSLLLLVGSSRYRQDTGQPLANRDDESFPYIRKDFVRTTWNEWREAHPDTDVYVGEISSEREAPTAIPAE